MNNHHSHRSLALAAMVLVLCLTGVYGCGKDEPQPEAQPPAPSQSQTQTPAQEPQAPEAPVTDPDKTAPPKEAADALTPFSYEEIADVFNNTEASLTDTYGQPQEISNDSESGMQSVEYDYGDMEFKLAVFEEGTDASVYEAEVANDKVPAPRGIKIGDTLEDVAALFPKTSDETIQDGSDTYQMLYGDFEYMGTFGYIAYDDDNKADEFMFAHEGIGMEIDLDNGKVESIRYFMTTN